MPSNAQQGQMLHKRIRKLLISSKHPYVIHMNVSQYNKKFIYQLLEKDLIIYPIFKNSV